MAAAPQQGNCAAADAAIRAVLGIKHPIRPAVGKVPLPLRKLLPDPRFEEGWRMLMHDISDLTPAERAARAWRLRVGIALCPDPDDVPRWAIEHLAALEAA